MVAQTFKQYHHNGNNTLEQPKKSETNRAPPLQQTIYTEPNHESEKDDILKSWDGPVCDSHYGRFENQEDAAADDRKDLNLHRCEVHQCNCREPFQHRSYVRDKQRRIEPMVERIVRLEQLVDTLVQHIVKKGESLTHHSQGMTHNEGSRHHEHHDERTQEEPRPKPKHQLSVEESLEKLEQKVESLMHQLHEIIQNNDSLVHTGHGVQSEDEATAFYQGRQ